MKKHKDILIWEAASIVFYDPKGFDGRGWYVRGYHSGYVMKAHLSGKPPPKHFGPDYRWEQGYCDTGSWPTKTEAMNYVRC
jgi:hypothetical protein